MFISVQLNSPLVVIAETLCSSSFNRPHSNRVIAMMIVMHTDSEHDELNGIRYYHCCLQLSLLLLSCPLLIAQSWHKQFLQHFFFHHKYVIFHYIYYNNNFWDSGVMCSACANKFSLNLHLQCVLGCNAQSTSTIQSVGSYFLSFFLLDLI